MTDIIRWGIIGCGNVTEVKSGPAFQKANSSALVAVMRRDRAKAADYARRHGVPRFYDNPADLLADPEVDAVYVATPPSSHLPLALQAAAAGKPCLVEKPMAMNHAECDAMVQTFAAKGLPLFVAYYRRALPRFVRVRELLRDGAVGTPTSVHLFHYEPLSAGEKAEGWRFNPEVAGAGLFFDLA
ncbi:MAG: gfo/Idh/MocA family oxidoreductase, partial [Acidobacteria bacterium]